MFIGLENDNYVQIQVARGIVLHSKECTIMVKCDVFIVEKTGAAQSLVLASLPYFNSIYLHRCF